MSSSSYRLLLLGELPAPHPARRRASADRAGSSELLDAEARLLDLAQSADTLILGRVPADVTAAVRRRARGPLARLRRRARLKRAVDGYGALGVDAVDLGSLVEDQVDGQTDSQAGGQGSAAPATMQQTSALISALHTGGIVSFGGSSPTATHRITLPAWCGARDLLLHSAPAHPDRGNALPTCAVDRQAWNIVLTRDGSHDSAAPGWFHMVQHLLDQQADLVLGLDPGSGSRANSGASSGTNGAGDHRLVRSRRRWALRLGSTPTPGARQLTDTGAGSYLSTRVGFWCVLQIDRAPSPEPQITLSMMLYPVHLDDLGLLAPLPDLASVSRLREELQHRGLNGWTFSPPACQLGQDQWGPHLQMPLGTWQADGPPDRAVGLLPEAEDQPRQDPDETAPFRAHAEIRRGLEAFSASRHLGASLWAEAAERGGARLQWVSSRMAIAHTEAGPLLIDGYLAHSSALGAGISTDKQQTHRLLRHAGVPVAEAVSVSSAEQAWTTAAAMPGAVVVKPADREKGVGVSLGLESREQVHQAYHLARRYSRRVIVEEYVDVETELRAMASDQSCVSITERTLPQVLGDGISTVAQLVTERNAYRSTIFSLTGMDAVLDDPAVEVLRAQGLTADSVPDRGELVTVGAVGGQSSGGDIAELSDVAQQQLRDTAVAAVAAVPGLRWGGVDLMVERGTGRVLVLEVNSRAGFGSATFPSAGRARDVAGLIWPVRVAHAAESGQPGHHSDSSTGSDSTSSPVSTGSVSTGADRTDGAALPVPHTAPHPVAELSGAPKKKAPLPRMLFAYAEQRSMTVTRRGPRLRELSSGTQSVAPRPRLLTSRGLGTEDLAIACRTVDRIGPLRQLLRHQGVPLVAGTVVSDHHGLSKTEGWRGGAAAAPAETPVKAQAKAQVEAQAGTPTSGSASAPPRPRDLLATPYSAAWGGRRTRLIDNPAAFDWDRATRWMVQLRPEGLRLRLLSLPDRVLTVLHLAECPGGVKQVWTAGEERPRALPDRVPDDLPDGVPNDLPGGVPGGLPGGLPGRVPHGLSASLLAECSAVARAAVCAVPQLRWAAVDVVVTSGSPSTTADTAAPGAAGPTQSGPTQLPAGATVLVEGMSIAPTLHPQDRIIAGDLTVFFDHLLAPTTT